MTKTIFSTLMKFIIAICSILLTFVIAKTLYLINLDTNEISRPLTFFITGTMLSCLFFAIAQPCRVTYLYVLGHELTHMIVAKLMFRKTSSIFSMRVSSSGGMVLIENPNIIITLAPYFIPFYTILIAIIYIIASCFIELPSGGNNLWLMSSLGISYGYHIIMTISSFHNEQPDLQKYGILFSFVFIIFCNFVGLFLIQFIIDSCNTNHTQMLWNELCNTYLFIYNFCETFIKQLLQGSINVKSQS